jgi:ketosteroid isomerase-like protein
MRFASTLAALALAVTVSACATAATQEAFTRADADAIRQSSVALAAAFNEKQIETVLGFYAENSIFMPPNAPQLRGRDPLQSFYSELMTKGASNLQLDPQEVAGHGPIAYEYGTYSIELGATAGRDRGKYVRVLRNMAGTWRAEKTIWSSDLPPAAAQTN